MNTGHFPRWTSALRNEKLLNTSSTPEGKSSWGMYACLRLRSGEASMKPSTVEPIGQDIYPSIADTQLRS
jgi:hypothetical protein